jgi:hypothetical protein
MKIRKRAELPNFGKLNIQVDMQKLLDYCHEHEIFNINKYQDLKPGGHIYENALHYRKYLHKWFLTDEEINKAMENNEAFYGENYAQLGITEYNESLGKTNYDILEKENDSKNLKKLKRVDRNSKFYIPEADERNYTKPNKLYTGYIKEILDQFKGKITRTRFAYAAPGFRTATHIDADTDYTIRIHIPIITNPKATLGVIRRGELDERHFPADGSVIFFNTGWPHFAFNGGDTSRIHLIIAVEGQDDIAHL